MIVPLSKNEESFLTFFHFLIFNLKRKTVRNLIIVLILISAILVGCSNTADKKSSGSNDNVAHEQAQGSEDQQISSGLDDIKDLDTLGDDLDQDLGLNELDNYSYE